MTFFLTKGHGQGADRAGYGFPARLRRVRRRTSGFFPLPPKPRGIPMNNGDLVADFELPTTTVSPGELSELLAKGPVVLFFYPAAMTGGCTGRELPLPRPGARSSRRPGAQRLGISPDAVGKQREFSAMHSFDYPLLSDPDGAVATQFGVRRQVRAGADPRPDLRHRLRQPGDRVHQERTAHGRARGQGAGGAARGLSSGFTPFDVVGAAVRPPRLRSSAYGWE